jgi:hypothetical protein
MKELPIRAIGIPWYALENYGAIKAMMKDGHKLPATYSQWRLAAEQAERQFRRQGDLVVRAHLDPNTFRDHCSRFGQDFDAQGRSHFAAHVAEQAHGDTH